MSVVEHPALLAARQWLGTPYRHQASTLGAGCDCLGLVRGVWFSLYGSAPFDVPAYAADMRMPVEGGGLEQAANQFLIPRRGDYLAGDVLLFRLIRQHPARHCAIYAGHNTIIHAQERLGVVEVPLNQNWSRRICGAFHFPD